MPRQPRSGVVSLAPHLTEWIFALGQGGQVVAIGDFDDFPPESQHLPRVGGYINPALEKITVLAPELIVVPGKHPKVTDYAALNRIPLLNVHMDSFDTIGTGLAQLGEALGCTEEAEALQKILSKQRDALARQLHGAERPKVLIITYRHTHDLHTLYTVGGASFVSEVVRLAGGDNIFEGETAPYFEAAKETVLSLAPEVIVEFHSGESLDAGRVQRFKDDWQAMRGLPAVKNGRVYIITEPHALRPGPRIMEIARIIAHLLHPGKVEAP